jgi:hypothetical protein
MRTTRERPLGHKTYAKIPHLPGSRTGPSDRVAAANLSRRFTHQAQPGDELVVREKLDGSCVAVALKHGQVLALGREGWRAEESDNPGRRLFARWVASHAARFGALLREGEWLVGEWLALAHATRYQLRHEPFVVFDLVTSAGALGTDALDARLGGTCARPHLLHRGGPITVAEVDARLGEWGHHGALDRAEGAVWRLERAGLVLSRAKFVRPGKVDGCYLPENSGKSALWNWTWPG